MAQIKKFGVVQTAKVAGILYFLGSLVVFIPFALVAALVGGVSERNGPIGGLAGMLLSGVFLIMAPVIYGVLGFVFVAIGCLVYNLVAGFAGGIEIEIE